MTPTRRSLLAFTAALAASMFAAAAFAQTPVKVEGAWARPTVQGQAAGGGFLKITGGAAADKLVAASAGVSKTVELHAMVMDGDVMRMREIGTIDVPPGKTVELKPGGLHVMFIGIGKPLKVGDSFPLTLRFEKAGEVKVEMKVMAQPAGGAMDGMHKH